jgi:hypothetical protein
LVLWYISNRLLDTFESLWAYIVDGLRWSQFERMTSWFLRGRFIFNGAKHVARVGQFIFGKSWSLSCTTNWSMWKPKSPIGLSSTCRP